MLNLIIYVREAWIVDVSRSFKVNVTDLILFIEKMIISGGISYNPEVNTAFHL